MMNCTEFVSREKYLSRRIDVYVCRKETRRFPTLTDIQPAQLPLGLPFSYLDRGLPCGLEYLFVKPSQANSYSNLVGT